MKITLVLAVFGICASTAFATKVNRGKEIFCSRASITDVRIQNCEAEPCAIKKGQDLPIEVDFIFETPLEAERVNFRVFASYWATPPAFYGSDFASESSCEKLKLSSCPAKAGIKYTLHSKLFVDPESQDTINDEKTGIRRTSWNVRPIGRENKDSTCNFSVELNIVE